MTAQILIADHDPLVRAICQRFLSAHGHDTALARDALQCIEQLQALSPDVLVLDPDILWGGGMAVLDWLKQQSPVKPVHVILADGHCQGGLSAEIQSMIGQRLERPTGLDELPHFIDALQQCLNGEEHSIKPSGANDAEILGSRSWK